ncbi:hypothetical protein phiKDA1_31 (endogenous virus) [Enterobacter phage phiKDA1]|uniref:Uncharacterized protein n=1 Tax=Enterobacter phage phiKDA1 TaxID=1147139 RepID=A0A0A6Z569_9CAUD|nr:hypothetical protein HOQ86_gp32 [Enterobacter phage phiKDA1]AFE86124.1 hypothetical protein phiKDA1_31 [Enterobacter phage phiKDA1]
MKKQLKQMRLRAWELFYADEFIKLELLMLDMAEQYPEQHRELTKAMAAAIHEQHDLDCLAEIGL